MKSKLRGCGKAMQWAVAFGLLGSGGCADDNAAGGSGVPGGSELWNQADPCVVDLYGSGGCEGAPRKAADLSWINVYWSIDLGSPEAGAAPFSSEDAVSARVSCWAESPGAPKLDMAYLSRSPEIEAGRR